METKPYLVTVVGSSLMIGVTPIAIKTATMGQYGSSRCYKREKRKGNIFHGASPQLVMN